MALTAAASTPDPRLATPRLAAAPVAAQPDAAADTGFDFEGQLEQALGQPAAPTPQNLQQPQVTQPLPVEKRDPAAPAAELTPPSSARPASNQPLATLEDARQSESGPALAGSIPRKKDDPEDRSAPAPNSVPEPPTPTPPTPAPPAPAPPTPASPLAAAPAPASPPEAAPSDPERIPPRSPVSGNSSASEPAQTGAVALKPEQAPSVSAERRGAPTAQTRDDPEDDAADLSGPDATQPAPAWPRAVHLAAVNDLMSKQEDLGRQQPSAQALTATSAPRALPPAAGPTSDSGDNALSDPRDPGSATRPARLLSPGPEPGHAAPTSSAHPASAAKPGSHSQAEDTGPAAAPLPVAAPNTPPPPTTHANLLAPDRAAAASEPGRTGVAQPPAPATQIAQQLAPAVHVTLTAPEQPGRAKMLTIELKPAELGRVEVRIERPAEGPAKVELAVERPETLLRLVQDRPALQQALDQAGIPPSARTIHFSLAGDPSSPGFGAALSNGAGSGGNHRPPANGYSPALGMGAAEAAQDSPTSPRRLRTGLDITA